jgi:hypothetical protein
VRGKWRGRRGVVRMHRREGWGRRRPTDLEEEEPERWGRRHGERGGGGQAREGRGGGDRRVGGGD